MRNIPHTQNTKSQQIDMAHLARQSSDAILAFTGNKHPHTKGQFANKKMQHIIQRTTHHAFISGVTTFAMIAMLTSGIFTF